MLPEIIVKIGNTLVSIQVLQRCLKLKCTALFKVGELLSHHALLLLTQIAEVAKKVLTGLVPVLI